MRPRATNRPSKKKIVKAGMTQKLLVKQIEELQSRLSKEIKEMNSKNNELASKMNKKASVEMKKSQFPKLKSESEKLAKDIKNFDETKIVENFGVKSVVGRWLSNRAVFAGLAVLSLAAISTSSLPFSTIVVETPGLFKTVFIANRDTFQEDTNENTYKKTFVDLSLSSVSK